MSNNCKNVRHIRHALKSWKLSFNAHEQNSAALLAAHAQRTELLVANVSDTDKH